MKLSPKALGSNKYFLLSLLLVVVTLLIDEAIFSDAKRRVNPQEQITANVHQQLRELDGFIDGVSDRAIVDLNRAFSRFENSESIPYFIFEDEQIIYWSTNRFVPKYGTLSGTYLYKFLELKSGQYIVRRQVINSSGNRVVEIFALLPLSSELRIAGNFENYGLNEAIFGRSSYTLFNEPSEESSIKSPEGIFLFSFEGSERMKIEYPNYAVFIFLLYLIAISFFLVAGYRFSKRLSTKVNPMLATALWLLFLLIVRLTMLRYEYPQSIIESVFFEPDIFAASWWSPSIGDFFLNQITLLAVFVFGYLCFKQESNQDKKKRIDKTNLVFTMLLLIGSVFYFVSQTESLLANSQWSFDVATDISFSQSKLLAYFSLFIIAIIPFLLGQIISESIDRLNQNKAALFLLTSLFFIGILCQFVFGIPYVIMVSIISAYLMIILYFRLYEHFEKANYSTFLYYFIAAFLAASISTSVLTKFIKQENLQDKQMLVTELQSTNDLDEFLLSKAGDRIAKDILIQTGITNPFAPKDQIRRTIRRVYLGDDFDNYDIEIMLFNGSGNPIGNESLAEWQQLKRAYATDKNKTSFEGLYLYEDVYPINYNKYFLFVDVLRYNTIVGHILVELDRKQQLNNSILPQLLLGEAFEETNFDEYDYAVFRGNKVQSTTGSFNYDRDFDLDLLDNPILYSQGVSSKGYEHFAIQEPNSDQTYVVSNPFYPVRYFITNFALFFLFMVAVIILIFGVNGLVRSFQRSSTTLSSKIQILLNFAFFLPLIIVSLVVLRLVNQTVELNMEIKYLSVTESAGDNLSTELQLFLEGRNENNEQLESRINEISQYAQADINLFNTNGRLIATNQRLIFENELLAPFINPNAMESLVESGNGQQLNQEQVGDRSFKATYYGIRSNVDNRLIGVLSMPFFDSEEQLKNEQREILSNILNAFTFIFVIFIVLSFLASRILTYPFKYLTERIKTTTLSNLNEPLQWNADDEIGLMVREYNKMLLNLEKNKKALAMSEKESAWREMAQQVAHEIKNPLTPMKLKLQHLKRVLSSAPDIDIEINKPIDSLLNQVDTLSDIATSFSSFAKMPIPISERLNVVEVLKKTMRLFKESPLEINSNIPRQAIWTMGDEKLLGRIFNNLILNAQQASDPNKQGRLDIEMVMTHNKVRLTFADNGQGIPEDLKEKVFIPKFSTKETGSGIGLAIAKRGVEHAGGSIWFESTVDVGTTFYLEFPLTD